MGGLTGQASSRKVLCLPTPPVPRTHTHLYYYDSLVQDDTRAHVTMACEAHHLQHWLTMEGHGRIRVSANDRDTTLLRRNTITKGRKHTRKGESLLTKYLSGGLYTPARRHRGGVGGSPTCHLCPEVDGEAQPFADERHLLLCCKHPAMVALREALNADMLGMLTRGLPLRNAHVQPHCELSSAATRRHTYQFQV
jgi:hypothetical protein